MCGDAEIGGVFYLQINKYGGAEVGEVSDDNAGQRWWRCLELRLEFWKI